MYPRIRTPRPAPNIVVKNAWQVEHGKQSSSEQSSAEGDLFKIDLRVQGAPQNAVLEDQGTVKNTKRDNDGASGSRLSNLPEWLEEFTDYLENAEVRALANISEDSDPERPAKVATGKHSIFLTSRKTDTVKAAREPRLRGLLAGSALAKQYLGQKNSVC